MSSAKQTKANQSNSQKSTGPTTAVGKSSVSKNSTTHGLLSKETVLPWEDQNEFNLFKEEMFCSLSPEGILEVLLVDKVVSALWRTRRINKIEAGTIILDRYNLNASIERDEIKAHFNVIKLPILETIIRQNTETAINSNPDNLELGIIFDKNADLFAKLQRYEAGLDRSFYKALHELQRLQAVRKGANIPLPLAVDITGEKLEE